ncbi:hypothetical protein EA462_10960 [Natrarchaeobius halalkaliphilus]|uniref:Uncharacterized protein n=2 Tax=Natrarchaeobius halalkaliphilus TaxID=1679091 RepID=A0A3N6M6H0_9EURY|nr:hypothetical protein EA462_10960 [Natrarchaeobius halalkaliphilus]
MTVLDQDTRKGIYSLLKKKTSVEDVNEIRRLSYEWKNGSFCDEGQTLERIYDSFLDIDRPLRGNGGELAGRPSRGNEDTVLEVMYRLSSHYINSHNGVSEVYRGVNTYDGMIEAVLDALNPERNSTNLDLTKLSNFTLDRGTADYHGLVVVRVDLEPKQAAIAADFFLPYSETDHTEIPAADEISKNEGEIRLIGDTVPDITTSKITVKDGRKPISLLFDPANQNTIEEHDYAAGIIKKVADENEVIPDAAIDAVESWFFNYFQKDPNKALNIKAQVEQVLDRSIHLH